MHQPQDEEGNETSKLSVVVFSAIKYLLYIIHLRLGHYVIALSKFDK